MTAISDFFKKQPLVTALLMLVVGFLLGWVVMGWGLWPVQYVNGDVSQLRPDQQQEYVRLVAGAYAVNQVDTAKATTLIGQLGPNASKVVSDTIASSTGDEAIRVSQLQVALQSASNPTTPSAGGAASLLDKLRLPILACGVIVLVGLVGGLLFWRISASNAATRASRPAYVPPAPRPVE